jgi:hypothetical protein
VSVLNEIVDSYEPEMKISGTNLGCFRLQKEFRQYRKKKLWEYRDELNTWIFPTAFDLQIR